MYDQSFLQMIASITARQLLEEVPGLTGDAELRRQVNRWVFLGLLHGVEQYLDDIRSSRSPDAPLIDGEGKRNALDSPRRVSNNVDTPGEMKHVPLEDDPC